MAEFNYLLQSKSSALDVNENVSPGIPENVSKPDVFVSAETETYCSNPSITDDVILLSEPSLNHISVSNEIISESFNIPSQSDDVKNVSTTILDPFSACENQDKSSEIFYEANINLITANDNLLESSGIVNELTANELNGICHQINGNPVAYESSDCAIHDKENNIAENSNAGGVVDMNVSKDLELMIADLKIEDNDLQMKEEEFHDAAQFFKDPSSFTFLEKVGSSSTSTNPSLTRSSLYVNFDPLHAKFFPKSSESDNLLKITEDDTEAYSPCTPNSSPNCIISDRSESGHTPDVAHKTNVTPEPHISLKNSVPDLVNNHLKNVSPRKSLGNILISFDSPITSKDVPSQCLKTKIPSEQEKLHTEEELRQALKIQELTFQETALKNQHDLKIEISRMKQEMESKTSKHNQLYNIYREISKELVDILTILSDKNNVLMEKLEVAEKENNRLGKDLKTAVEDLQSVENTFAEFHKRYEQCKSMLRQYSQNEGSFKEELESMQKRLQEKEEMYKDLESRTGDMLDKANLEVLAAKKAGDSQAAVLKAQLKKAELKISSLESDVKQVTIENSKLIGICDDLMAKVSEA